MSADLCPQCAPLKRPYPSHLTVKVYDAPQGTVVIATCNSLVCDYFDLRALTIRPIHEPRKAARSFASRITRSVLKGMKVLVFGI